MTDDELRRAAEAAGIETAWRDVLGDTRHVAPDTLRAVLATLGNLPDIADPPLHTAEFGESFILHGEPGPWRLIHEDGDIHEGHAEAVGAGRIAIPGIHTPGYHVLQHGDGQRILAVAPPRCWTVADAIRLQQGGGRAWGLTAQIYSLRRAGDAGFGDFAALETLARRAGAHGCAAIAISPVHAQLSADPGRFSPYSPSSRGMLNVLHAARPPGPSIDLTGEILPDANLIDWPHAAASQLAALRRGFATATPAQAAAFDAFRTAAGDALERHARFEALHQHFFHHPNPRWNWRDWPAEFQNPDSAAVAAFAAAHAAEVSFHAFAQFLADRGLQAAQRAAGEAGMPIGLIADVAVGTDPGGSDCWRRPDEMLQGLTIGAPPDIFNPAGQNWGVTTYAPHGLRANGYGAFLEMLRATLRHAGGMRIDHVMGLARLWVIPAGAAQGAYLRYPLDDLLRLVKLESWRHRAIVLGEDLGTLPDGFRGRLEQAGLAGMRVLWFERDGERFIPPTQWSPDAAAMTSTHDLPSVVGWWSGRDIAWREALGHADIAAECHARARDRAALWAAFHESGATEAPEPGADDLAAAANAAAAHIGRSACALALLPLEDALALPEQPNIPGTTSEHPNWRRRLPGVVDTMLDAPATAARLAALAHARTL